MNNKKNKLHIELHVPDFAPAIDFYTKLGFKKVWERKPEGEKGYLVMEKDNQILCFWPGNSSVYNQPYFKRFPTNTKRGYGVEIVITVEDIESYYAKVRTFAKVVEELVTQPWGLKDFRVEDPFGYYLRFTEPHDILNPENAVE